jgi:diguanylate cyclase (GGDEF)-like protein
VNDITPSRELDSAPRHTVRIESLDRVPGIPVKTGLLALMLVSLIPALLIACWLLYDDYREREAAVVRETELQARALMSTVDRELARVDTAARMLAASPLMQQGDFVGFDHLLRSVPLPDVVRAVLLIDRTGQQRINTMRPVGAPLGRTSSMEQVTRVLETGRPLLFDLIPAETDGSPLIVYSMPVRLDGQVAFTLNTSMTSARLSGVLTAHPLPSGWVAALVDSKGTIVARSRDPGRFVGQSATPALLKRLQIGDESGITEATTKEGEPVVTAFVRSQMTSLRVIVGAPKAAVASEVLYSIVLFALLAVLVIGIALAAAFRMANGMSKAIAGLIDPALALGSGRPVDVAPGRLKETNALGLALRQASRMIDEARHQAHHDALTGLPNRVLFDELLAHQLHVAVRAERPLAILAIDLDRFKEVNDTHGHAAGDLVLKIAAERILAHVRGSDVVSRRGGDEFTTLLIDGGREVARRAAAELVRALSAPYPDILPVVTASVGIAVFEGGAPDGEALLQKADAALYAAKHAGKARFTDLDAPPA